MMSVVNGINWKNSSDLWCLSFGQLTIDESIEALLIDLLVKRNKAIKYLLIQRSAHKHLHWMLGFNLKFTIWLVAVWLVCRWCCNANSPTCRQTVDVHIFCAGLWRDFELENQMYGIRFSLKFICFSSGSLRWMHIVEIDFVEMLNTLASQMCILPIIHDNTRYIYSLKCGETFSHAQLSKSIKCLNDNLSLVFTSAFLNTSSLLLLQQTEFICNCTFWKWQNGKLSNTTNNRAVMCEYFSVTSFTGIWNGYKGFSV